MVRRANHTRATLGLGLLLFSVLLGAAPTHVLACGGFFCQAVPIDQAGEQIVFREENGMVTVLVLIQYAGEADDFSWVLPVPGDPDFELGSDLVFPALEQATRPQFFLTVEGEPCDFGFDSATGDSGGGAAESDGDDAADDGVDILEEVAVGPFEITVVSSTDPNALATWLTDNGYDIGERGAETIAPYVDEGFNFVAMRLLQDQGVGDIQPLKMTYMAPEPCVPIRLTSVAAVEDMGILVWILGETRAVPVTYPHVEVNYTKLDWFNGTFAAYADYQDLVTEAMNEQGNGQGFVTDYAGTDIDVLNQLPDPQAYRDEIAFLGNLEDDGEFYSNLVNNFIFPQDQVLEILRRELPLPEGEDEVAYQVPDLLEAAVGAEAMAAARTPILQSLIDTIIEPLETSREIFEGMPYLTRLYTTMSPAEMTRDPFFNYNPDLGDQPLVREATMTIDCVANQTEWQVTLGAGTGRDGETIINGTGLPPGFGFATPEVDQPASLRSIMLTTAGAGQVVQENDLGPAEVNNPGGEGSDDDGGPDGTGTGGILGTGLGGGSSGGLFSLCGAGIVPMSLLTLASLCLLSRSQGKWNRAATVRERSLPAGK